MKNCIHIVHHVDTEGPLYESLDEKKERIINLLSLKKDFFKGLESLDEILEKILKTKKVDKSQINFNYLNTYGNFDEISDMLDTLFSKEFTNNIKDSYGNSWKFNWHIMDHVGFEDNPRRRITGHNEILKFYINYYAKKQLTLKRVDWHFHPIPFSKKANVCASSYWNSSKIINEILVRRLIEFNFFPVVNRAGFHTVRPDSNIWLEMWMPFDASNQSLNKDDNYEIYNDSKYGSLGDWRGAKNNWELYNPSFLDWRKEGNLRRTIAKCLNLKTRFRNINENEINLAFQSAEKSNKSIYLGITNHDFRNMKYEIEEFYKILKKVSKNYKIPFVFSDSIDAFNECLGYGSKRKNNKIKLGYKWIENNVLEINILEGDIWGPQPFLAIKTKNKKFFTDNFDFGTINSNKFYYTFNSSTIEKSNLSVIKVASNDKFGNQSIINIKT